jgi:hypothetical protein
MPKKDYSTIEHNSYIKSKILGVHEALFYGYITDEWVDYSQESICMTEIGCDMALQ